MEKLTYLPLSVHLDYFQLQTIRTELGVVTCSCDPVPERLKTVTVSMPAPSFQESHSRFHDTSLCDKWELRTELLDEGTWVNLIAGVGALALGLGDIIENWCCRLSSYLKEIVEILKGFCTMWTHDLKLFFSPMACLSMLMLSAERRYFHLDKDHSLSYFVVLHNIEIIWLFLLLLIELLIVVLVSFLMLWLNTLTKQCMGKDLFGLQSQGAIYYCGRSSRHWSSQSHHHQERRENACARSLLSSQHTLFIHTGPRPEKDSAVSGAVPNN